MASLSPSNLQADFPPYPFMPHSSSLDVYTLSNSFPVPGDFKITCLHFNANATLLAVGGELGMLVVWDVHQSEACLTLKTRDWGITSLLWHPSDASTLFVGYSDGEILSCNISSFDPVALLSHEYSSYTLTYAIVGTERDTALRRLARRSGSSRLFRSNGVSRRYYRLQRHHVVRKI